MIYLMRNGHDEEGFTRGWSETHLTPEGVKESVNARNFIVNKGLVINNILSSDITRAKETARIINTKLNVPYEITRILNEQNKGTLNGISLEKAKIEFNEFITTNDIYKRFPQGESLNDFYNRILYYFNDILKDDNTLIVTHSGVINMIYYILTNSKLDFNKERFNVTHGSIHEYNPKLKKIKRIY